MAAFNNEIASAERIGLHLAEIGRIQNNAGGILQFTGIVFAICVYFFNSVVLPSAGTHRQLYGSVLAADGLSIAIACAYYLRCVTLSVGWSREHRHPQRGYHLLSALSEAQIEKTLYLVVRTFRRGTYCFAFCFLTTLVLICLVALGELEKIPM